MVATQVLPTIQEIWEMINDYYLRTMPPSEELVREIEGFVNESFNDDQTIYDHAQMVETDLDVGITNWIDEYRFKTQFVNQYTERELRTHYDDLASLHQFGLTFPYEGSTTTEKMYCIVSNYIRTHHQLLRLR